MASAFWIVESPAASFQRASSPREFCKFPGTTPLLQTNLNR